MSSSATIGMQTTSNSNTAGLQTNLPAFLQGTMSIENHAIAKLWVYSGAAAGVLVLLLLMKH